MEETTLHPLILTFWTRRAHILWYRQHGKGYLRSSKRIAGMSGTYQFTVDNTGAVPVLYDLEFSRDTL